MTQPVNVCVAFFATTELVARLDEQAKAEERNRSEQIRYMLKQELERIEREHEIELKV